jgi:hypothetical protein
MAPNFKLRPALSSASGAAQSGMSSVLRLAARSRLSQFAAPSWLGGLKQALRSAGPGTSARPLHGVLCDLGHDGWTAGR